MSSFEIFKRITYLILRAASGGKQSTDLFQGGSSANFPPKADGLWSQINDLQHFPDSSALYE